MNTNLKFKFYTGSFVQNLIWNDWSEFFDFLHVIDFIEDTGEETYLITNSLWFGFFLWFGFHREICLCIKIKRW